MQSTKTNQKKEKRPVVYLRWLDSATSQGWDRPESKWTGPSHIESIGYVVYEDSEQIQIASSCSETGNCVDILSIPKRTILEIRRVKYGLVH